ncbi:hypothetical protein HS088_TW02G00152 [Tripterygium wilfordii]|uniref:Uncharacterized protein n=1 Tax=Tripterygium wilfordii TaxID=458696 RepID=A0A7J7DXP4_TRIWF|nr:hypothetical protein HS088_TW02G00152 [Tripterygium wilfordii]
MLPVGGAGNYYVCKEEQVSEAPHLGDATSSLVTATAPVVDSGTPELSTLVEAINVIESALLKNSAVHDAIQSGSKNNDDNLLPTSDEFIADSLALLDVASKENKDNVMPDVDENSAHLLLKQAMVLNKLKDLGFLILLKSRVSSANVPKNLFVEFLLII